MMTDGEWFRIPGGPDEGRLHMAGWKLSAIKGEPTDFRSDGWLSYGICPVCSAMVQADEKRVYGDMTWDHEQWHARTDHPIPAELAATPQDQAGVPPGA